MLLTTILTLTQTCQNVKTSYIAGKCCDQNNAFAQYSDLTLTSKSKLSRLDANSVMRTMYHSPNGTTGNFDVDVSCMLKDTVLPIMTENCVATAIYYQMLTGALTVTELPVDQSVRRSFVVSEAFRFISELLTRQANLGFEMSTYNDFVLTDEYGGPTTQSVALANGLCVARKGLL